jgi:hypothetical protein
MATRPATSAYVSSPLSEARAICTCCVGISPLGSPIGYALEEVARTHLREAEGPSKPRASCTRVPPSEAKLAATGPGIRRSCTKKPRVRGALPSVGSLSNNPSGSPRQPMRRKRRRTARHRSGPCQASRITSFRVDVGPIISTVCAEQCDGTHGTLSTPARIHVSPVAPTGARERAARRASRRLRGRPAYGLWCDGHRTRHRRDAVRGARSLALRPPICRAPRLSLPLRLRIAGLRPLNGARVACGQESGSRLRRIGSFRIRCCSRRCVQRGMLRPRGAVASLRRPKGSAGVCGRRGRRRHPDRRYRNACVRRARGRGARPAVGA